MKTEKLSHKIEYITLAFILILYAWKAYPISNSLVPYDSSDFSAHIFKIWFVSENNLSGWNPYWYGGSTLFKQYPPLAYLIPASFTSTGLYLSYYIFFDIVWLMIPLALFIFFKNFNLTKIQTSVALIISSMFPGSLVFFRNSNLPFITSFLFSILFLIYFKKSIENKTNWTKPAVLLISVLLSHILMAGLLYLSVIVWFLSTYPNKQKIYSLLPIFIIPVLIVSFWYIPFSYGIYSGREGGLSVVSDPIGYTTFTANQRLETMGIPTEIFLFFAAATTLSILATFIEFRSKLFRQFLPWLLIAALLFTILDYKRIVILMPIPISMLVCLNLNKKHLHIFTALLIISSILVFSSFSMSFRQTAEYPETGNRVVFYDEEKTCHGCSFFSAYLPAIKGNEIINGWLPQSQNTNSLFEKRGPFLKEIMDPISISHDEFNKLAKASMLNYIVVSSNSTEILDYFRKNVAFSFLKEENGFSIFKSKEDFSYIEIDSKQVKTDVKKFNSKITALFDCSPGTLTIKETYDKDWKIKINGGQNPYRINDYGFIESDLKIAGECTLEMYYQQSFF